MVGSAYLYSIVKKFSAIQTALLTLMATVHPEEAVPARTAFSFADVRRRVIYELIKRQNRIATFRSASPFVILRVGFGSYFKLIILNTLF